MPKEPTDHDLNLDLSSLTGAQLIALATTAASSEPRAFVEKLINLAYDAFDRALIGVLPETA